ncbi:TetR/AcrR family transcriptional regulator [Aquihabitans sp. G128]|uniref:TetR/AcrR family transcriptional regulator n=1 Tax=Aquihabitans sp. G128 TaxID=2849779 RepID=UPI001C24929F|nr:TetR/AcrR family transcriptional regulator [Aquihabitans sp. G128]QXC59591.1 TetR/AcrR family transcriptional regulator [Aquihabitans sp. G128]
MSTVTSVARDGRSGLADDRRAADLDGDPTTDRILGAAYEQLLAFGLRRSSIEDIAKRAGLARVTVYRRFGSKDELIREVLLREGRRVFAEVDAAVASFDEAEDQLVEGFVAILRTARSHPLLQRLLTTEAEVAVPSLTTHGAPVVALGREYLAGHLLTAQEQGRLGAADVRAVAEVLVRLTLSFLLTPESVIPLATDDDARAFAHAFVLPALLLPTAPTS